MAEPWSTNRQKQEIVAIMASPPDMQAIGKRALDAGIKAYEEEESKIRANMPLAMKDLIDQHNSAAANARAVFEGSVISEGQMFGSPAILEHKQELEKAMCLWKVESNDLERVSVVEIIDGRVRLSRVNHAVSGKIVGLVDANWSAIKEKFSAVWNEIYGHIRKRVTAVPCQISSVEQFDEQVVVAKISAKSTDTVEGMEADFDVFLGSEDIVGMVNQDRAVVVSAVSEARMEAKMMEAMEKMKKEFEALIQATKEGSRRELKVVLERAKNVEGRLETFIAKDTARSKEAPATPPSPPPPVPAAPAPQPTPMPGASNEAMDQKFEHFEKKLDKRFRDASLSTTAEVAKVRADCSSIITEKEKEIRKGLEEGLEAVDKEVKGMEERLDTKIEESRAMFINDISSAGEKAGFAASLAEQLQSQQQQQGEYFRAMLDDHDRRVAENCRQMFTLLEEQSCPKHALNELREEVVKELETSIERERSVVNGVQEQVIRVDEEVQGLGNKLSQGRDEIQALFGMLGELKNQTPKKSKLWGALDPKPKT